MAIASSGAVSASDIRSEYGLTGAVSFSSLYRGGSNIRAKAGNNNAVNLAASVPTSGTITFANFRGTAKGFRYTFTAGATDQDASALFGSDYSVDYPKDIVINSGVELGATSTSEEALEIDTGGLGTITVTNNGTLTGAGGAVGADGGDAFEAAVNCTFVNNGTVRAGGGGGGAGGNGSYTSTTNYTATNQSYNCSATNGGTFWAKFGNFVRIKINGSQVVYGGYGWSTPINGYYRSTARGYSTNDGAICLNWFNFYRQTTNNSSGGAGGVGAGYNQSAGSGSSGGTNAGTGGSGGAFGASGSTGANGNSSNGSSGGASGKYLRGSSFVTFTNNGTAQGGTA